MGLIILVVGYLMYKQRERKKHASDNDEEIRPINHGETENLYASGTLYQTLAFESSQVPRPGNPSNNSGSPANNTVSSVGEPFGDDANSEDV